MSINIEDPTVTALLTSCGSWSKTKQEKHIIELEELDNSTCIHKKTFATCIICQYEKFSKTEPLNTRFRLAKKFYKRFAMPMRSRWEKPYPENIMAMFRKELLVHGDALIRKSEASDLAVLLHLLDDARETIQTDDEMALTHALFAKYFDYEKILNKPKPSMDNLTDAQKDILHQNRRHIFWYQLNEQIKHGIRHYGWDF